MDRRDLLKSGGLAALGFGALGGAEPVAAAPACTPFAPPRELTERLRAAAARPVLRTDRLGSDPVIIASVDVLRRDANTSSECVIVTEPRAGRSPTPSSSRQCTR